MLPGTGMNTVAEGMPALAGLLTGLAQGNAGWAALFGFLPGISPMELVILGIVGVLLFGSRLPEVGRSLGKGLLELRKGLKGIEDELHSATSLVSRPATASRPRSVVESDERLEPTAPKFEPPTAAADSPQPGGEPPTSP